MVNILKYADILRYARIEFLFIFYADKAFCEDEFTFSFLHTIYPNIFDFIYSIYT